MKKTKYLLIILAIFISLCLSGCELAESFMPGTDTDGDNSSSNGGISGTPNDEGEKDDSNGNGDGSEDDGDSSDKDDHVCDFKRIGYAESTCSSAGWDTYKCSCGEEKTEPRELSPHTEEIIPATEATENSPATTEGKKCSICGYVIIRPDVVFSSDYTTPGKYDGKYAYNYIASLENGENLTKLYNSIDICADLFHISGENASDDLVVSEINFSEFGLTQDEAIAVWSAYVTDHPLYYWISKGITYTPTAISLKVDEEYKNGDVRNGYNAEIYAKAEEFIKKIDSDSEYIIAMMLHDLIISSGDYAYEADGVTPKDDTYAHNILGILTMDEGVCESYAKSFQMMLNYCGVENVFVSGYAGEPHAWNLVKLDDGKWYWCDLTWDDNPGFMWGVSYRYFCVSDNEQLMNSDGPYTASNLVPFINSHTPAEKCDTGINFMYELPESSTTEFADSDFLLRETFKVGDFTYAIVDAFSVQLVEIECEGDVVIPTSVEYVGRTFDVVAIGCINESGLFKTGSLVSEHYDAYGNLALEITSISIPKSVELIWDDAFNIQTLKSITVDPDNAYYASLDGVLFTKDLTTLVKYPSAKEGSSYTLPDETVQIAAYAFCMYYSNVELVNLETIILGENILDAGIAHYGYGYANYEDNHYRENEWLTIEKHLKGDGKILTKSGDEFVEAA